MVSGHDGLHDGPDDRHCLVQYFRHFDQPENIPGKLLPGARQKEIDMEILDVREFLERIQGDKALLWELLGIFVEDFQQKKGQLREALHKGDATQIRKLAHALKGSSANISAHQLYSVLLELEKMGKNNTLVGADKLLVDMEKKFEALLVRISRLREELK